MDFQVGVKGIGKLFECNYTILSKIYARNVIITAVEQMKQKKGFKPFGFILA